MEIFAGEKQFYALPDIEEDFKNNKARRQYRRDLKSVKRQIERLNKSHRGKRLLRELSGKPEKCPGCGSKKVICWGSYERHVRSYFSKKVRTVLVKRYKCKRCNHTGSILPKYLQRYRRYSNKALRDMVDAKLWLYAGYRKVGKWRRIHGSSHTTVIREIVKLAPLCRNASKSVTCRFSSIVSIDEVYFRKVKGKYYMSLVAVDSRYGRILYERTYAFKAQKGKEFGDIASEDIAATKTDGIRRFLDELLAIVVPKVIITDDNTSYSAVITEINKYRNAEDKIKHQLCTFHVMRTVNKHFQGFRAIKLAPKFEELRTQFMEVFQADTFKKANELLDRVLKRAYEFKGTSVEEVFTSLSKNRERLFPFLKYGLNRTNNPIEFYFSFVKRFQHVSRKFSSFKGISSLLSVYALFYNFMPRMEGRNKGKTPFMMAGWHHRLDMYEFLNYPACLNSREQYGFKYKLPKS